MFLADWEISELERRPLRARWATRRRISVLAGWLCILVGVFKQMARALVGGGRFFFGASFLLAPSPILRIWWPDDAALGPIALGLARPGWEARDAVLGLGILAATSCGGGVLWRLAVGCGWRRRRRPGSDVDECLALWPAHPATALAGTALNVMVQLYLAFDQEN